MNYKTFAILNINGVDYKCVLWGIRKNQAINMLNNSELDDKDRQLINRLWCK